MKEFLYQVLVQIPEPVYFSLFLIIGKNIKEKRLLLIGIMIMQYLLLMHIFPFNVWFQLIYTFMSFVNLKVLYKEKAQVTDIFLFTAASIMLIFVSLLSGLIHIFNIKYVYALIINRIVLFLLLFVIKDKINLIYQKYYSRWNRSKDKTKVRSLTLRNVSVIVFNLMFYIINIGLIYAILTTK